MGPLEYLKLYHQRVLNFLGFLDFIFQNNYKLNYEDRDQLRQIHQHLTNCYRRHQLQMNPASLHAASPTDALKISSCLALAPMERSSSTIFMNSIRHFIYL